VFVLAALVFCGNLRSIGAGDTLPTRYLPFSLLRAHSTDLDEFTALYDEAARQRYPLLDGIPYFLRRPDRHYLSAYSPAPALLALPVYALPVAAGMPASSPWVAHLEKLSAALIAAASVALLFAALRRLTTVGWAFTVAVVYAFGTSTLSISSQALWQHGPSQLFLALALYFLVRLLDDERALGPAALALGVAVVMRSTNLFLAAPVCAFILYRYRRSALRAALLLLVPVAIQAAYDLLHFHTLGTGLGQGAVPVTAPFSQTSLLEGVAGVLVSPARGLFVFSPVLLLSLPGIVLVWRHGPVLFRALSLGLPLVVLLVGKWIMWWGGHTFGPRLLADLTPVLCFFLYPLGDLMRRRVVARTLFAVLAALSVSIHLLGAFFYDMRWDGMMQIDRNPSALWLWRTGPLAFYAREAAGALHDRVVPAGAQRSTQPTSVSAPAMLAASYEAPQLPVEAIAGGLIATSVTVRNSGRAVWLASTAGRPGTVRLGWRWREQERDVLVGSEALPADVGPGAVWVFDVRMAVPAAPGAYTLVIDLLSDRVTWFSDQGSVPVRRTVTVQPADLSHVLAQPRLAEPHKPHVAVATDRSSYRPGDLIRLEVRLRNPGRPRGFDAYLVLRGPEASQFIYDGQVLTRWTGGPWPAWVKGLPLPARGSGRFAISLASLPGGRYIWYFVLTESGTFQVLAAASTGFDVGP
jgi:uncharacterized protein YbaR (Trm112 family)